MAEEFERRDEDPAEGKGGGIEGQFQEKELSKAGYSALNELNEKEQKNPIAWKWAISELTHLRGVADKYYILKDTYSKLDKEYAVYKAHAQKGILYDVISSVFLAIGPIMIGLVPVTFGMAPGYICWILLGLGLLLLGGAGYVKYLSYKK